MTPIPANLSPAAQPRLQISHAVSSPVIRFALSELVHSLVREAEKARSISGAHFQTTSAQQSNGSPGRQCGTSVFLVGLLSQRCVHADGFRSARRQRDVIDALSRGSSRLEC